MRTLEQLIASVPEGMTWLLRSDEEYGFFAHVMDETFENDPATHERGSYYVYGPDLLKAFEKAIKMASSVRRSRMQ